jgi:hypothetical protein
VSAVAGGLTLLRRRLDARTRQLGLACLLFFLSAGAVLLVSDLFEFSWRYQLPAVVTLVPAGALGIGVLLSLARGRRAAGPAPASPADGQPAAEAEAAGATAPGPG